MNTEILRACYFCLDSIAFTLKIITVLVSVHVATAIARFIKELKD